MAKTTTQSPGNGDKVINRGTGVSIGVLLLLLLPLITACGFVAISHEKINSLTVQLDIVNKRLEQHEQAGIDGIAHPGGLAVIIQRLENEMRNKTMDRWSKADDNHYMDSFVRLNSNLKLPEHRRITPLGN